MCVCVCLLSVKVTVKDSVKCKYYELNVYGVQHNKVARKVFPSGIIVGATVTKTALATWLLLAAW